MEPRISLITLGVHDLERSLRFYRDGLGLQTTWDADQGVVFFRTHGACLALYPFSSLAKDAGVDGAIDRPKFTGITLAHNVRKREDVDRVLQEAEAAGARIEKPAQDTFWGGYAGYFSDPDGYLWEVAWGAFDFHQDGSLMIPSPSLPYAIRAEFPADHDGIQRVHQLAFGRGEEALLVDALRESGHSRLSLVAEMDGQIVGHILFSDAPIITENDTRVQTVSLAPMAVSPEFQRQGIGSELVRRGLDICRIQGHQGVIVLGHPKFYSRFGFSAALARPLRSPFSGDAWMAVELVPVALDGVAGRVV
jgi:uncharacterized protein